MDNNDRRFEIPGNKNGQQNVYAQELIQQDVLKWVDDQAEPPFFLFYAMTLPHGRYEINDQGIYADKPWAFWDLLPTFAELGQAEMPPGFYPDGYSLVEFLKGGAAPDRDYFYWELHERQSIQAIRWGDWKAVRPKQGETRLRLNFRTAGLYARQLVARETVKAARKSEPLLRF